MADVNRPKAVALISGSNRGIGAAIASELIEHGYAVSLGARRTDELEAAHGPEDDSRMHAEFDAFRPETAKRWVDMTADRFGRIDALINNAGSAERVRLDEDNEEALDRLWTVNVKAPLRLVRLCLPHLERCGRGRIVNIASLSGKRVRNSFVGYNMTKFAMMGLTHTVRHATWDSGIRATAICPGFVNTRMSSYTDKVKPDEMIQPETLATLVRTTIELPNTAAVAELLVNCRREDMV
ncbi:MAG: SDR family NAD(P)-dependent oxidoreductase [Rhodobacteraceae bacterium]|nr:SDR family NAD(P)-dependent oxidoreductase [Paracoccaceae bacterium]